MVLDGGRYEMVVNSCFEDLEGMKSGIEETVGVCSKGGKKEE